ncbi:MAG: hypothetical protein ACTHOK_17430 [Nocardioidaceae bacterium]
MLTEWQRVWDSEAWRAEVTGWVDEALTARGIARTGGLERSRARIWSTVLAVPTDAGRCWFKVNCPGLAQEAAVVAALAELVPAHVVAPLAVDARRGWLLSPDHGRTLREVGPASVETWCRVVRDYAELQRATVPHGEALAAAGLLALPPEEAAGYLASQLDVLAELPATQPRAVGSELIGRVRAVLPQVERLGARLAAGPVPLALDHNDLHDNNTFAPVAGETGLRFFDFGDALWAHPFGSMLIVLNVVTDPDGLALDASAVMRLLDAYLDRWADLAPRDELHELLDAALVLGRVHRYLSWDRSFTGVPPEALGDHAGSPAVWLELLAECLEPGGSPRVL